MRQEWLDSIATLSCVLDLKRCPVGIRVIKTEEECSSFEGLALKAPINYCQMIVAASRGHVIKACSESFKCRSGARALGIDKSDPKNAHGENWDRLGLYKGADLCREIRESLCYSQENAYGLLIGALHLMPVESDVVMIAANPFNVMRIVQGYAYHYGMLKNVNVIGNQAICLECTARPYVLKDMNVSVLCIGTRHRAGWQDDEMAVGIPQAQFIDVVDGILSTLNQMESDRNKQIIQAKFEKAGIPYPIRFHYNYYMEC